MKKNNATDIFFLLLFVPEDLIYMYFKKYKKYK